MSFNFPVTIQCFHTLFTEDYRNAPVKFQDFFRKSSSLESEDRDDLFLILRGMECPVLIPDSSEFLGSRDFSRFSEAASAEENREKSRESRNSRESGISNWSSPIGGVFYPRLSTRSTRTKLVW